MSKVYHSAYHCDFCNRETDQPERWFRVISLHRIYSTCKPQCSLEEEDTMQHACNTCGYGIHITLSRLNIQHEFDAILKEREPWEFGRIFIP
jgi:hypothetical protein